MSLCDRPISAADADFHNPDMATALDQHGDALCRECYRHLALAIYLAAIRPEILDTRKQAIR